MISVCMYAWLMSCSQRSYFEPSGSSRIFLAKILCATSATNDIVRSRLPGIAYIPLILIVHPIPIQQLKINPLPNESTNCTLPNRIHSSRYPEQPPPHRVPHRIHSWTQRRRHASQPLFPLLSRFSRPPLRPPVRHARASYTGRQIHGGRA
jgi:hypothetical protein